jgi:hypothetical protein
MSVCYDFEKWTMVTFASVAVSLTIGLLLINIAHAQLTNDTNEERSYLNCYRSFAKDIMLHNMISPLNYTIDLNDPVIKKHYSNICNFLHEKTGIWGNSNDDTKTNGWNWTEFESKYYPNGLPQSVEELFNKTK